MRASSMHRATVARVVAVASASVCPMVVGVVLAQYTFTLERKTGRKTKIIEMMELLNSFQFFLFLLFKTALL
uniref:Uncharacterized protein n=1 Tax=Theropithecus gelada TaxID=9565 RepID=A0A8D2FC76_THEGE